MKNSHNTVAGLAWGGGKNYSIYGGTLKSWMSSPDYFTWSLRHYLTLLGEVKSLLEERKMIQERRNGNLLSRASVLLRKINLDSIKRQKCCLFHFTQNIQNGWMCRVEEGSEEKAQMEWNYKRKYSFDFESSSESLRIAGVVREFPTWTFSKLC